MPSPKRRIQIVTALVIAGIAVLLYSTVVGREPLLGAGLALSSVVVAVFVYYGGTDRQTLTRATIGVTLIYGAFTLQLPVAIIAACAVYLSAWLTGSDSPVNAPDTEIFPVKRTATEESEDSQ
jgi:peptidoglycan biosynthesis protein MviN/MurJ (putative lipid II flippase)